MGVLATLCGAWRFSDAHAAQVTFQWDYTDPRATRFVLHCGQSSGDYGLRIDVGNTRTATVSGLAAGATYHCAAKAYSATQESTFSNEVPTPTPAPPNADFGMNATSGAAPLTVRFTNSTLGAVRRWEWDFGDGTGSTLQAPTHVYATPGRYTVVLTAFGPGGSVSKTSDVSVTANGGNPIISAVRAAVTTLTGGPPAASFTVGSNSGATPFSVSFVNKTAGASGWRWEFGDGNTSAEQSPTHTYYIPGTYNVVLTATGPGGSVTTVPTTITVIAGGAGGAASQASRQSFTVPGTRRSSLEPECSMGAPSGVVLGDDVLGTPDAGHKGIAVAFSTAASDCANVGSLSVYLDAKSTATKLLIGLYSDQDGHPGTLLSQGAVLDPIPGTWNTIAIAPRRVDKDMVYWIAILGTHGGTVYYHTRAGSCAAETSAQTGLSALPSAWFTGSIVGACPVAAYGTSTP